MSDEAWRDRTVGIMVDTAVFDVDGTICFDGTSIAPPVVEALDLLRSTMRIVFASARPIRDLLPVLPAQFHDETLIGGNGAFTRHAGTTTVLGLDPVGQTTINTVIEQFNLAALIDGEWDYSYTGDPHHQIHRQLDTHRLARNVPRHEIATYSKVVLFTTQEEVISHLEGAGLSVSRHPGEGFIDIAPSGVTKHHALKAIGIHDGTYTGFGNDANDVLMLKRAGISYCVGDHPALRFADHHIARENVAEAIRELGLNPRG